MLQYFVANEAHTRRVQAVQWPEITLRIPPRVSHGSEFVDLSRINTGTADGITVPILMMVRHNLSPWILIKTGRHMLYRALLLVGMGLTEFAHPQYVGPTLEIRTPVFRPICRT